MHQETSDNQAEGQAPFRARWEKDMDVVRDNFEAWVEMINTEAAARGITREELIRQINEQPTAQPDAESTVKGETNG